MLQDWDSQGECHMKLAVRIVEEPNGLIRAWCPALPGCAVRGTSRQDAARKIEEAIRAYLASLNVVVPPKRQPIAAPA